ncbi:SseB family protein [Propionibacteriaceae bacterium Y2011]|uniref:SseB family protein n=1 Tax=Microlunatus sp. Y2014 TaxID=3418488 RepID=UPI003B447801
MTHERSLGPSPFPDDDGLADPQVRQALASALTGQPADYLNAVAGLCTTRLMVPVVAQATEEAAVHARGPVDKLLTVDKEADMAVVMLQSSDGRKAMLGFTGTDALHTWQADARPVPVTLDTAARAATQEGATALIIDMAGPHPVVLEGEVLAQLAQGHRLVALPDDEFGWMQPRPGDEAADGSTSPDPTG